MAEVYVPETPDQLFRLARGYTTPDATEPSLAPMPQGMQDFLAAIADLGPQSHVRSSISNESERAVLPAGLQTEAYARKVLTRRPEDVARGELELERQLGVRLGHGRQVLNSGASIEYLVPDTALLPSEHVGRIVLREALGAALKTLQTRRGKIALQLYPSEHVPPDAGGLFLIYPEGTDAAPELTRGLDSKTTPPQQATAAMVEGLEEQFYNLQDLAYSPDTSRDMIERVYDGLA